MTPDLPTLIENVGHSIGDLHRAVEHNAPHDGAELLFHVKDLHRAQLRLANIVQTLLNGLKIEARKA